MISGIENINPISAIAGAEKTESSKKTYNPESSLFETVFQSAIQNVKDTNAENVQAQYLLATGQLDNPAALMIAASKYQVSVDLLIQLRNKALDAYSELTRINM